MYVCMYVCMYQGRERADRVGSSFASSVRFKIRKLCSVFFLLWGLRVWELLHSKGGGYLGVIYFMNV